MLKRTVKTKERVCFILTGISFLKGKKTTNKPLHGIRKTLEVYNIHVNVLLLYCKAFWDALVEYGATLAHFLCS